LCSGSVNPKESISAGSDPQRMGIRPGWLTHDETYSPSPARARAGVLESSQPVRTLAYSQDPTPHMPLSITASLNLFAPLRFAPKRDDCALLTRAIENARIELLRMEEQIEIASVAKQQRVLLAESRHLFPRGPLV
jgi:hypothetical protein